MKEMQDVSCISLKELKAMKDRSLNKYQSNEKLKEQSKPSQKETYEAKEKAKARKDHMLALDSLAKEKENRSGQQISEAKAGKIRKQAQEKLDQNEDIVKLLNTFSQRAVAFAIRDQQIIDKNKKENEEKEYETRMDLAMELDRLKELKLREEKEKARIKKRIEDRKVIEEQIEERRQQRILQEEEREQENQQMLATIKKYQQEEEERARIRKVEAKRAQLDVIRLNEKSVEMKKKQAQLAKEEDEKIIAYQKQRDEKLRQRELEECEERRAREILQKKMLASQTKSIDRQAQLDELRARRAMEEKERMNRQKDLDEALKRKRDMQILHEARKKQEDERYHTIQQEKAEKVEEYNSTIKLTADMVRRERDEQRAIEKKNEEFRTSLRNQIKDDELKRKAREKEKREEGQNFKTDRVSCME